MIEHKINEFFGDAEATGFGTGWWSGVLSAFFGFLAFGAVLCLHFPALLTSPELRPHYPMHVMRVLVECLIVSALLFGIPPGDPLTLTSGTLLVILVTLVGALAPAISAVRVSPLLAMRAD